MHNKSLSNRVSFALVALLYLSFYLVSPFFHFHHQDSIWEKEEVKYHSHLLHDVVQKTNATECHHILDQDDEHNHPVVINAVITNLPNRFIDSPNDSFFSAIIIVQDFTSCLVEAKYTNEFDFGKVFKNKCVHAGSNVSPPLILAS